MQTTNDQTRDASPFLSIERVGKTFLRGKAKHATKLHVLDGLNLAAPEGEFLTVIGPSGCGKTTLLNCIAGLTSYDEGEILLDGRTVDGPGPDRAVVFQNASLLPWRTVERNIAYGLELRRQFGSAEIKQRVAAAIELVGLTRFEKHYPHEISGGMQQRANLARALAVDPKLVLMDEPFGALDALTKEALQNELAALVGHSGRTHLFITHDIQEAIFLGGRVIVMAPLPSRIALDLTVPFPRPREREITETAEFTALVAELRATLRDMASGKDQAGAPA